MVPSVLAIERKAQLAIEFLIILGISVLFLTVYLAVSNNLFLDYSNQKAQQAIELQGTELQKEILLASIVHDGYHRTFTVPALANGFNYSLNATPGYLTLSFGRQVATFPVPLTNGSLTKGTRTIQKQNGIITVT